VKLKPRSLVSSPTLFLAAALLFPACEKKEQEPVAHPPVPVTLGVVEQKNMPNHKEWIGNLQGTVTSLVKPNVAGNIMQRDYTEGTVVKQGEPLFQIDPAPFQATLDQAKADLSAAQANATRTEQDFVRAQSLLAGKVISIQEFQNKQQAYQANMGIVAQAGCGAVGSGES
jgi:membrane fusion protein, multidrug efflux system